MRNLKSHPFNTVTRLLNFCDKSSGSGSDGNVGLITITLRGDVGVGPIRVILSSCGKSEGVELIIIILDSKGGHGLDFG